MCPSKVPYVVAVLPEFPQNDSSQRVTNYREKKNWIIQFGILLLSFVHK